MNKWTVQDEINLQHWVEASGFSIVYLPKDLEWGYIHSSEPDVIHGGFKNLSDLKQYFSDLKGDRRNVQVVSEGDFQRALEAAGRIQKFH